MKLYQGQRTIDGIGITVDDELLDTRFDIKVISKNGFGWGFDGKESAQLALALLADHYVDNDKALANHEIFMREIVANFGNEWEMTSDDIDTALANIGADT